MMPKSATIIMVQQSSIEPRNRPSFCLLFLLLKEEYNRLMADENAADSFSSNLLELAPNIIMIAEKRNISSPEVQKFWISVSVNQVQKVTMKLKN